MSDYTPKTDTVRMRYVHDTMQYQRLLEEGYEPNVVEINLEFDRWLAKRDSDAAKAERERIIDLLRTRLDDCYEKNDMGVWSFMPELFIALIKGKDA